VNAVNISDDTELYSDRDVRVTGSMLTAGAEQYDIRRIKEIKMRRSRSWPLGLGLSLWLVLVVASALIEAIPSWLTRAILITLALVAFAYALVALVFIVGWSFVIPAALSHAGYYQQKYVLSITLDDRRVAIKGSLDHVDPVARALTRALDGIGNQDVLVQR
jgi:hypothetical protein